MVEAIMETVVCSPAQGKDARLLRMLNTRQEFKKQNLVVLQHGMLNLVMANHYCLSRVFLHLGKIGSIFQMPLSKLLIRVMVD